MHLQREITMLFHQVRLVQGVEERQADLIRQILIVRARQAIRVREIARLLEIICGLRLDAPPRVSIGPLEFDPGQVVWSLRIGECPDSSVWIEFDDNGAWFTLGARLTGLLRFLAFEQDKDDEEGKLVGYRSRAEVLAYLEETSGGRKYCPQYPNKLAHKMRDKLRLYDKRILIVSNKEGIRFMVRRGAVQYVRLDQHPSHPSINVQRGGGGPARPPAPPA